MTAIASKYRETLGRLVLLRTLGALSPDEEDRMLDDLDELWQGLSAPEREAANQYAAALARGRMPVGSSRSTAANNPLQLNPRASRSSNVGAPTRAEYTFIPVFHTTFYVPPRSEGGGDDAAA